MQIKNFYIGYLKGATSYELQIWRFWFRYIHLKSENNYYGSLYNLFKRLKFTFIDKEDYYDSIAFDLSTTKSSK